MKIFQVHHQLQLDTPLRTVLTSAISAIFAAAQCNRLMRRNRQGSNRPSEPDEVMDHSQRLYSLTVVAGSRWRGRLQKELAFRPEFEGLDHAGWRSLLATRSVTSKNHDTVLSINWPG